MVNCRIFLFKFYFMEFTLVMYDFNQLVVSTFLLQIGNPCCMTNSKTIAAATSDIDPLRSFQAAFWNEVSLEVKNMLLLFHHKSRLQKQMLEPETRFLFFFLDVFERKRERRARKDNRLVWVSKRQTGITTWYQYASEVLISTFTLHTNN